jgi:PKD repeat protein
MALSPVDSNKLFIITNDDTLHICSNALSSSPTFRSYHTPNTTYNTAGIVVIDDQPNVVYMYNGGDIYMSSDTGITWADVTYNYPYALDIEGIVHDKYTSDQSIFIANTGGVYFRNSGLSSWEDYSTGLPTVADIQGLDAFNDGSPSSRLRAQFYGRGMWEAPINTINKTVAANFASDIQYVCDGRQVHFSDSSYNNPTYWNWSFPGGNPSSSTQQDPVVTYSQSGTYPVTLTAGNNNSSDTKNRISYITVYALDSMPVSEGFEEPIFPPANWTNYDGGGDSVVWEQCSYGAYGTSTQSMFFDNYSYNETGLTKSMQFATDLRDFDSVLLTFDVAYQTLQNYSDSLEVTISTDCGQTFQRIYIKGGNTLATAPHLDSPSAPFFPTPNQWRTDSVNLAAYSHQSGILLSFNNISGYGTDLYVDNINLHGSMSVLPNGINMLTSANGTISIYPNPTKGLLTLSWSGINDDNINVSVYDIVGAKVNQTIVPVLNRIAGQNTIDLSGLSDGIYYIKTGRSMTKITLLK